MRLIPLAHPAAWRGRAWLGIVLLAIVAARSHAQESPPAARAWRVTALDQVDLWYHGVAVVGYGVAVPDALYDPGYAPIVRGAKERQGLAATPLDRAARTLATTFRRDPAFEIVHFLPLYFATAEWPAMLQALRAMAGDDKASRLPGDARTDRAVGALAAILPRQSQRAALRRFAELLDAEWRMFLRAETARARDLRTAQARALEQRWNVEFAPALAHYLAQIGQERGTIVLSPPLGHEGRMVERMGGATAGALVAITAPRSASPEDMAAAAFDVLRELCFATSRAVSDPPDGQAVEPAAAEQASRAAAVRCGALVLQRYLPRYRAAYQARFLAIRRPMSSPDTTTDRFASAFPLPPHVERRLTRAIESP